jgi:hypothetical protein
MKRLTFFCDLGGVESVRHVHKKSIRRARIVDVGDGLQLRASFKKKEGDWTLTSPGGTCRTFSRNSRTCLEKLLDLIEA